MRIYGYARVSTTVQNLNRQLESLKAYGIDEQNILVDKKSGKDFERKSYNLLVGTENSASLLRDGDLLVVTELDRLGRNYQEIKNQWHYITQVLNANIKVLDMPLLDTSQSKENSLDAKFVANLALEILSYVAEKERRNIREKQQQGIDAALKAGRRYGRPSLEYPSNWAMVYTRWQDGIISTKEAFAESGVKGTSFYNLVNRYEKEQGITKKRHHNRIIVIENSENK